MDIRHLREEYPQRILLRSDLRGDPLLQLKQWLEEAMQAGEPEPNAFQLATASVEGLPSARTVLLKLIDERGLVFFTNRNSRKALEITENPSVAATFLWHSLHRQVVLRGKAFEISRDESEAYFATRPRGSQLGAWASRQDEIISSREELEKSFEEVKARFADQTIPCPPFWGGFRIVPEAWEFWQGGPHRLHDRFLYRKEGSDWNILRLMP